MDSTEARTRITPKMAVVIAAHTLVAWALCGAIMLVGRELWSIETALIVHALGVPVVFTLVSLSYFAFFAYTTPVRTATIFMVSAILLDLVVVATFVEKSYEMFASVLGTWIPFALMFTTTYVVGSLVAGRRQRSRDVAVHAA